MSAHDPTWSGNPFAGIPDPGAGAVADLRTMDDRQALAVMLLRDLRDGPMGEARLAEVFVRTLGSSAAREAIAAWTALGHLLADGTRRPVVCRAPACCRASADEAVIAQVLILSALGAREDAMLILSLLVEGDRLLPAVEVARRAGLAALALLGARARRGLPSASLRMH